MYKALYRKWRSKNFDEVIGQEHITTVLKRQSAEGKVSHAYLFCGTRGTGKTSCAKILAKAVNCLSPVDGNPCGTCESCLAIDSGTATDVLEIDAASNNSVDNIRNLRDEVLYPPSQLKKRVYIVDEVHMLSGSAFNALLKTLEEPPEYVMFILATTELDKIPPTILSRCQRYEFRRIDSDDIRDHILKVSAEENIESDREAAALIARFADGGMRDALSLLESCSAGTADGRITPESVMNQLGATDNTAVAGLYLSVSRGDIPASLAEIDRLHRSAKNLSSLLDELIAMTRDLLVIKYSPSNFAKTGGFYSREADMYLREIASGSSGEKLLYYASVLEDAQSRMSRYAMNRKTLIETAIIRMCDVRLDEDPRALLARIAEIERRLSAASPVTALPEAPEAPPTGQEPVPAPDLPEKKPEKPLPAEKPSEDYCSFSAELLDVLRDRMDLYSFAQASDIRIAGDTVKIYTDYIGSTVMGTPEATAIIRAAAASAGGRQFKIDIIDRSASAGGEAQTSLLDTLGL